MRRVKHYYPEIYGLPLRCKVNPQRERDERCANLYGLLVKPRLLALMESARTGPQYADGHYDRFSSQADGASVNSCAITSGSLAIGWWTNRRVRPRARRAARDAVGTGCRWSGPSNRSAPACSPTP